MRVVPAEVHRIRNSFVDENTELFLKQAAISLAGKDVLAVGCSMAELHLCNRHGAKTSCLDIVPALALLCQQATQQSGIDASWVCGDGECLPFQDEMFDAVVIRQALHHMIKYYSAIAEFFRVLRVGGTVLIVDEPFSAADPSDASTRHRTSQHWKKHPNTLFRQARNPEGLLADKYHSFSLLNCISALRMHSDQYELSAPQRSAAPLKITG